MDIFAGIEGDFALKFVFILQGFLVIFFVVSPLLGKFVHQSIAKASSMVLIVCTMLLIGNVVYMGMVYGIYSILPKGAIHQIIWAILSFATAFSLSILVGRYMSWMMSDNFNPAVWEQEYDDLTEADMMPFDRRRKQEMTRRKHSRHD
jgi:hypothetical protein